MWDEDKLKSYKHC